MIPLDKAVVIRYQKGDVRLEVLADPEGVLKIRKGEQVRLEDILASDEIFRDARKGERASEEEWKKVGKTVEDAIRFILLKGEFRPTTEQRRRMLEEKKRAIAVRISKIAINPQTGTPHPPERVLKAMEEVRVNVDPFQSVEEQVERVVSAIRREIPLRIESRKLEIVIPPQYVGKAYGLVKKFKTLREEYLGDGALRVVLEVPAGMVDEVLERFNDATRGDVRSRLLDA